MAETRDFDQIATLIKGRACDNGATVDEHWTQLAASFIAEQLRQTWNARGAADCAKLAAYLSQRDEGTLLDGAIMSVDAFDRILHALDR